MKNASINIKNTHDDNVLNLEGSFGIEGITISTETKRMLKDMSLGKLTRKQAIEKVVKEYVG